MSRESVNTYLHAYVFRYTLSIVTETPDGPTHPPILHTPDAAARELSVSRTAVFQLIRDGQLESIKVGRLRRVPHAALVAYVDRMRGEVA